MTTFFTALVFSYTLQKEPVTVTFWLNSYDQCLDAMDSMEDMYDFLADHVSDNRIFMICDKSNVKSNDLVKPRLRPNT
jgi:hypothetical protein